MLYIYIYLYIIDIIIYNIYSNTLFLHAINYHLPCMQKGGAMTWQHIIIIGPHHIRSETIHELHYF